MLSHWWVWLGGKYAVAAAMFNSPKSKERRTMSLRTSTSMGVVELGTGARKQPSTDPMRPPAASTGGILNKTHQKLMNKKLLTSHS